MAKFDPVAYMQTFKDAKRLYSDMRKKGRTKAGTGKYFKAYGKNVNEDEWLGRLKNLTGREKGDIRGYTSDEFAEAHYKATKKLEKNDRLKNKDYKKQYSKSLTGTSTQDAKVDLDTFQSLLNKLESSKKRQQRQKSVEGRRDIYAGGLASMMTNF